MGKTVGLIFNEPEQIVEVHTDINGETEERILTESADAEICLDNMTVPQLKSFAKENGIDIGSASKKADIINAIIAAGESDAEV